MQLILSRFIREVGNRFAVWREGGESLSDRSCIGHITDLGGCRVQNEDIASSAEHHPVSRGTRHNPFDGSSGVNRPRLQFACIWIHPYIDNIGLTGRRIVKMYVPIPDENHCA